MTKSVMMFALLPAIAAAALKSDMLVSTDWLSGHLKDPKVVVLHVAADRSVYDAGHIPGAQFLAITDLAVTRNGIHNELPELDVLKKLIESAGVSDDSRVIVYSEASVLPATRTYFTLDYLGHGDQAALLDGGLEKWKIEGHPLTKEAASVPAGHFTPRPKPELVVQMDEVKQMAGKPTVLLDVRPATDYAGEKGGHIPGALGLYWIENQAGKDNQALKTEALLRAQYEALGVNPDRQVVTYCNSGMQATQTYFTLKYLGYNVRLYDGSMSEWKLKGGAVLK